MESSTGLLAGTFKRLTPQNSSFKIKELARQRDEKGNHGVKEFIDIVATLLKFVYLLLNP